MPDATKFLVRALLADGVVSDSDVRRAGEHAAANDGNLIDSLVSLGAVTTRRLAVARARICEYPFVDLAFYEVDIRNAGLIPRGVAERLGVFPLFVLDGTATIAMLDPLNLQAIDQVRQLLRCDVDPVICDSEQLGRLIARAYSLSRGADDSSAARGDEELTTGEEPIVAAVNQIIGAAMDSGVSDVHINPDDNELHLRYRVDGVLVPQQGPPKSAHAGVVQRLKVLARLDLAQTRKPQDGKFRFQHRGQAVDVRLSLVPTIHGENVVMRLLRSGMALGSISDLAMPPEIETAYSQAIHRSHGMILVTGPTGSGKTTTLYTAINELNMPSRNIMTIEDPVEIRLPMIRQVQINAEIGLTFATALRSILRQDPDVVLVGEIRDQETARIAVQAAMTGHLVFSTLHTNDAVGSVARLRDFGVPPFAINQGVLCVLAQRLLRRVCAECAVFDPQAELAIELGIPPSGRTALVAGAGCASCLQTGYKGRIGVYEMLRMTQGVRRLVEQDASMTEIAVEAQREGMRVMLDDGIAKAQRGWTTLREVARLRATIEADRSAPALEAAA